MQVGLHHLAGVLGRAGVEEGPKLVKDLPAVRGHGRRGHKQRNQRRKHKRAPGEAQGVRGPLAARAGLFYALLGHNAVQGLGHGAVKRLGCFLWVRGEKRLQFLLVHCCPSHSSWSRVLSFSRAVFMRDFTVPVGRLNTSAISATE